ncbi:GmrSD restriction endonuclease domain-containing protein [Streptomyces antibioticus]|uniref:GmrSD restriction endonuclease domain-containing protein n=1 Tax=Streptomyces antibioticus TaxID=1890 RepID=UPI0036F6EFEE
MQTKPEVKINDADFEEDTETQVTEYDIVSAPNDFNTLTINSFIEQGAIQTPGFQRNYVWDIKRASKLIESLILGLPVPQVFLYEENRNRFLIIDGQQRLLTVFFFMKGRFPRKEKRGELRQIMNSSTGLTPDVLANDEYFTPFRLQLAKLPNGDANRFSRLTYANLGDHQTQFNLRPIRNVIVKQVSPQNDDSSVFEMFNRLNTGGVNLNTQEIRACLYHSAFFENLFSLNENPKWRDLLDTPDPDFRMRDIEMILRTLSLREGTAAYGGSMTSFINSFCKSSQSKSDTEIQKVTEEWNWFLELADSWGERTFWPSGSKFSILLFEAVYSAAQRLRTEGYNLSTIEDAKITEYGKSDDFAAWSQEGSTKTAKVVGRLEETYELLKNLAVVAS